MRSILGRYITHDSMCRTVAKDRTHFILHCSSPNYARNTHLAKLMPYWCRFCTIIWFSAMLCLTFHSSSSSASSSMASPAKQTIHRPMIGHTSLHCCFLVMHNGSCVLIVLLPNRVLLLPPRLPHLPTKQFVNCE